MTPELDKEYRTKGGWKAKVVGTSDWYDICDVNHVGKCGVGIIRQRRDGTHIDDESYDLIAEWEDEVDLTKITTPFGLLDKETQERLKAHGGPYEYYISSGWTKNSDPAWSQNYTYRVKPKPVVEYKKTEWLTSKYTGYAYTITEKFVDGKYDSYTVDMVPF